MRVKRGKDRFWRPIKFKSDGTIYAKCKCGFFYPCYKTSSNLIVKLDPNKMYRYCPNCGARKKGYFINVEQLNCTWW